MLALSLVFAWLHSLLSEGSEQAKEEQDKHQDSIPSTSEVEKPKLVLKANKGFLKGLQPKPKKQKTGE